MIFLQVGQCGIQVGQSIFEEVESSAVDNIPKYPLTLFDQLVIDTEKKVWNKRSSKKSIFPSVYIDKGGSGKGNNWANGFFDSRIDEILEEYRKLAESTYIYDGCMLIHRYNNTKKVLLVEPVVVWVLGLQRKSGRNMENIL